MTPAPPAALTVACPHCGAGVDEPCELPAGEPRDEPHARRLKAAQALADRRGAAPIPDTITGDRWRRLFRSARLELEQRGDWTTLAAEELETLTRNMANADDARDGAEREPLVKGSTGQKRSNPLWDVALRLDAQALALAKALKLTPDTRGTSAPAGEEPPAEGEPEDGERDELADLDDLARQRRKHGRTSRARR